jgi:hypothetical protein
MKTYPPIPTPLDEVPPPATEQESATDRRYATWPRVLPIALGAWLVVSAFLWPHRLPSLYNSVIVGALIVVFGITSLNVRRARWVNVLLASWLFISTLLVEHLTRTTAWNDLIVSLLVIATTLAPSTARSTSGQPQRPLLA